MGKVAALMGVLFITPLAPIARAADIPDRPMPSATAISGYYKVSSSSDPIFNTSGSEWFLDFGKGAAVGKTSGSVAVSMRQNPNVRTRILVWQFFPASGNLVLGYQTAEGSKQAVMLATWKVTPTATGMILRRGEYQMVIHRAAEGD